MLLLVAMPGQAQDGVTMPVDSLPVWAGYIVGGMILATFAFAAWVQHTSNERVKTMTETLTFAVRELSNSVPASIRQPGQTMIEGGVDTAYDTARRAITERTATTRDDELLDEAERRTLNLLRSLGLVSGSVEYNAAPGGPTFEQVGDDDDTSPLGKLAGLDSGK